MKLTWIIQDGMFDFDSQRLTEACQSQGNPVVKLDYGMKSLYGVPTTSTVMFYGTIPMASELLSFDKWKPCVIRSDNFDYEVWSKKWAHCLNRDAQIFTVGELQESFPTGKHFVRPCLDSKAFTGKLFDAAEFRELAFTMTMIAPEQLAIRVAISEPKTISEECRLFVVGDKVSTGSFYHRNGKRNIEAAPQEVIDFAERAIQTWTPAEIFTLDIGRSGDQLYVVETGCFNSAGLYGSDLKKLVTDINKYYEDRHVGLTNAADAPVTTPSQS